MHVVQEETWQQASEPQGEPKPVPHADAEPAVQQNGSSWTHIEPVKQELKPVVRFNPLPKVGPPLPSPGCQVISSVLKAGILKQLLPQKA